jgi:hypothetical protein
MEMAIAWARHGGRRRQMLIPPYSTLIPSYSTLISAYSTLIPGLLAARSAEDARSKTVNLQS